LYFGLHKTDEGWVFREWAPRATGIFLVGTFNQWQRLESFRLKKMENGIWEGKFPADCIHHEDLYKLHVCWEGGFGERIPAWCNRVV
ncbi:MAG TPA: 1,4-alpha-glucan-branching enzyme, partial [Porphyromonadaceae bacterium]|nr:1,4-alpha-glucan-branching enzyme [Porphyromonadaceae bacterium]